MTLREDIERLAVELERKGRRGARSEGAVPAGRHQGRADMAREVARKLRVFLAAPSESGERAPGCGECGPPHGQGLRCTQHRDGFHESTSMRMVDTGEVVQRWPITQPAPSSGDANSSRE